MTAAEVDPTRAADRMEALGRLAGGVAHELNNVLMVIAGYTEMLAESADGNREVMEGLRMITDAAERATGITRQLLIFGRRQAGDPRVIDVSRILGAVVPSIRRLVPASVTIRVDAGDGLGVRMDPALLERLLVSLAVFSKEAVPEGATLSLAARTVPLSGFSDAWGHEAPAGDYVQLSIAHSRVIEAGARARLFEPFFTTKPMGKGAALTLAVAYGIVSTSAGYIDVVTEKSGSRFDVYLPLVAGAEATDRPDGPAARPAWGQ
jgi:signal transduction histidine kinase